MLNLVNPKSERPPVQLHKARAFYVNMNDGNLGTMLRSIGMKCVKLKPVDYAGCDMTTNFN